MSFNLATLFKRKKPPAPAPRPASALAEFEARARSLNIEPGPPPSNRRASQYPYHEPPWLRPSEAPQVTYLTTDNFPPLSTFSSSPRRPTR